MFQVSSKPVTASGPGTQAEPARLMSVSLFWHKWKVQQSIKPVGQENEVVRIRVIIEGRNEKS